MFTKKYIERINENKNGSFDLRFITKLTSDKCCFCWSYCGTAVAAAVAATTIIKFACFFLHNNIHFSGHISISLFLYLFIQICLYGIYTTVYWKFKRLDFSIPIVITNQFQIRLNSWYIYLFVFGHDQKN